MSDASIKVVSRATVRATVRANMRIYDLVLKKWVYTTNCGACGRRRVVYVVANPSEYSFIEPEVKP